MTPLDRQPEGIRRLVRALAASMGCEPDALWFALRSRRRLWFEDGALVRLDLLWNHAGGDLLALGRPRGELTLGWVPTLTWLNLMGTGLSSLTLVDLPALTRLDVHQEEQLASLDLRGCPRLDLLDLASPVPAQVHHPESPTLAHARLQGTGTDIGRLLPPTLPLQSLRLAREPHGGHLSLAAYPRLLTLDLTDVSLTTLDPGGCPDLFAIELDEVTTLATLVVPTGVQKIQILESPDLTMLDVSSCLELRHVEITKGKRLRQVVCTDAQVGAVKGLQRKGLPVQVVVAPGARSRAPGPMPALPAARDDASLETWRLWVERWLDAQPEEGLVGATAQVQRGLSAWPRERGGRRGFVVGHDGWRGGALWLRRVLDGGDDPRWSLVESLSLDSSHAGSHLKRLGQREQLGQLRDLTLTGKASGEGAALGPLAQCVSLEELSLRGDEQRPLELDERGVGLLAAALARMPGLRSVSLDHVKAPAGWLARLVGVDRPALELLSVSGCGLDAEELEAACAAWRMGTKALWLRDPIGDRGLAALAGCGGLDPMANLYVSYGGLTDRGVTAIERARWVPGLAKLDLNGDPLGKDAFRSLARAPFGQLRELLVREHRAGADGLRALVEAPWVGGLRALAVGPHWECGLDDRSARVLLEAPGLDGLEELDVGLLDGLSAGVRAKVVERFAEALGACTYS